MAEKWAEWLPARFKPNWKEFGIKVRPHKEAGFMKSVYHKAIAVNVWRALTPIVIVVSFRIRSP